jgi:hypothetical protein
MNAGKEEETKSEVGRLNRLSRIYGQHGVRNNERIDRTRMTRSTRIISDKTLKLSVYPCYQHHPRSINTYIDLITALIAFE